MKDLVVTIFLSLFLIIRLYSQDDYRNGYVILNTNDTIFGLINYGSNSENTTRCTFRKDENSPVTTYLPDDLAAYRLEDSKYFVSKKINDSRIFLEFLFDGIINLYVYFDESGVHFLVEKIENEFSELKNETRIFTSNNVKYEKESKEYIGSLKYILRDSPSAVKKSESVTLNANSLIDLSEEYHREVCPTEECITYASKKVKLKFSLGLVAGATAGTLEIIQLKGIMDRFRLPLFGSGFRIGTFVNLQDPFFSRRLSLQSGATVSRLKYYTDRSSLNLTTFNIPFGFRYSIPFKKFSAGAVAGINYNYIIEFNYSSTEFADFEFVSGRSQSGYLGGLEFSRQTISGKTIILQIRYEGVTGYSQAGQWEDIDYSAGGWSEFDTKSNGMILLLGYQF